MSRNLRTFSTLGRSILKSRSGISHSQSGHINIQHVRILRPSYAIRHAKQLALTLAIFGFAWHRLGQLDDEGEEKEARSDQIKEAVQHAKIASETEKLGPGENEVEQAEETEPEIVMEDDDDIVPDEQPEDAWFIPLGFARQLPQSHYKGTDPEWQGFVDFAKDKQRGQLVRNELAGIVGQYVSSMKNFQNFLGTPTTTGKYWLDCDFPDGPPPEYVRTGIEIAAEYIALVERPVDPINLSRLNATLWPTATGSSLWDGCNALWQLQTAKLRKALNIPEPERPKSNHHHSGYADFSQLLGQSDTKGVNKNSSSQGTHTEPPNLVAPTTSTPDNLNTERPWIFRPLPGVPHPNTDMHKATTVFRRSLAKNWKHASAPPPRGTFLVSGLVEVYGPRGICTLDVRAAYDPRESQWIAVGIGLRRLQKRKQKPKGG